MSFKHFVFVRTDLESLTPGKACAQVAHAATQLAQIAYASQNKYINLFQAYKDWERPGPSVSPEQYFNSDAYNQSGFGTTIVLEQAFGHYIFERSAAMEPTDPRWYSGRVFDPTYPLRDGLATHLIPVRTCDWVFADLDDPYTNTRIGFFITKAKLYNGYQSQVK